MTKYLVRPDDHTVFSLNEDRCTYSNKDGKDQFPDHLHHKYLGDLLISLGFYIGTEEDMLKYRSLQKQYYDRLRR